MSKGRPRVVPNGADRLYVNLPPELAQRIRAIAAEERRTVTAQVELLLEHALRQMQVAA